MKKFKKIMAVVTAMAMTVAMSFGALAATDSATKEHTITISNIEGDTANHTYAAYKVFAGDYDEASKVLSNVTWGEGVDSDALLTALKDDTTVGSKFKDATTAADVAKAMDGIGNESTEAKAIAEVISSHLGTAAVTGTSPLKVTGDGYYFVKDADVTSDRDADTAKSRYIMQVVKDVKLTAKSSVPTVEKKVKEKNDTTGVETGWQDAADYDIGDEIPYQITGTLPSTFADYKTYTTYTFTDTLSEGLTITAAEKAKITVKVGQTDVTSHFDISVNGQVLTVSLKSGEDLKKWTDPSLDASKTIVVNYSATLNDKAKIGSEGNPNTVNLTYSNNPNAGGEGDKGKTPDDKVIVFTYEIKALKVHNISADEFNKLTDEQKEGYTQLEDGTYQVKLEGAGFTLYKKGSDGNYTAVGNEITGVTTFEFKGTDAGEYKLVETKVPAGYNKADDIVIEVTATYDTSSDDPKLTSLTVTPDTAGFVVTTTTNTDEKSITTDGVITGKVLNNKGANLPTTGGMGTTILYVAGAILVIAGAAVLVIKKRHEA